MESNLYSYPPRHKRRAFQRGKQKSALGKANIIKNEYRVKPKRYFGFSGFFGFFSFFGLFGLDPGEAVRLAFSYDA